MNKFKIPNPNPNPNPNTLLLTIFLFITLFMIFIIFVYINKKSYITTQEPFDCTLHISDVDPKHVSNYTKYDNNIIGCGICNNSNLYVNIESTCPTNKNGSVDNNTCRPQFSVSSSDGIPVRYDNTKTREGINKFFCPIRKK